MKTIKNFLYGCALFLAMLTIGFGVAACGGSSSDDGDDYGNLDEASRFFVGNWQMSRNNGYRYYLTFDANGSFTEVCVLPGIVYVGYGYTLTETEDTPKHINKGEWRYEKADDHSGTLYTTVTGFETIYINNIATNYWAGIAYSDGNQVSANKLSDSDRAENFFYNSGNSGGGSVSKQWVSCSTCSGSGQCTKCSGSGTCSTCGGTGKLGSGRYTWDCTSCRLTTGKCSKCSGSGKCATCGGAGGRYQ